jgi:hypothetical protein
MSEFGAVSPKASSIATRFVFAGVRGFTMGEGLMAEMEFAEDAERHAAGLSYPLHTQLDRTTHDLHALTKTPRA